MRKLATLLLATIACSSGTVGIDDEPVAPRSEVKFHEVRLRVTTTLPCLVRVGNQDFTPKCAHGTQVQYTFTPSLHTPSLGADSDTVFARSQMLPARILVDNRVVAERVASCNSGMPITMRATCE
jgi:hypothetical protein